MNRGPGRGATRRHPCSDCSTRWVTLSSRDSSDYSLNTALGLIASRSHELDINKGDNGDGWGHEKVQVTAASTHTANNAMHHTTNHSTTSLATYLAHGCGLVPTYLSRLDENGTASVSRASVSQS